MVLIWVALPHPDRAQRRPVIALVVATWALAALLLAGRFDRASHRAMIGVSRARGAADLGDAAGDRRPRERVRAVLRLPRAVRVRGRRAALRGGCSSRSSPCSTAACWSRSPPTSPTPWSPTRSPAAGSSSSAAASRSGCSRATSARCGGSSEDRFRRGFADSPVGMAIISADWRWLEVNDALCRMLGRTREELDRPLAGRGDAPRGHRGRAARSSTARSPAPAQQESSSATCARTARSCGRRSTRSSCRPPRRAAGSTPTCRTSPPKRAAQEAVARQARQQAAVAALGRFALDEQDLEAVMDRVAETVAATLEIELCEVFEITPRGSALRLVAGVGWPEGQVRRALRARRARRRRSATRCRSRCRS